MESSRNYGVLLDSLNVILKSLKEPEFQEYFARRFAEKVGEFENKDEILNAMIQDERDLLYEMGMEMVRWYNRQDGFDDIQVDEAKQDLTKKIMARYYQAKEKDAQAKLN